MIIAMCATRNWYFYTAVALYSILSHNKIQKVYLFIEDDKIPYIQDKCVEFININKTPEYVTKISPNYNTHYSKMSYIRCFFSKYLKEDKVLYLDVDALVVGNIEELWNMDLEENYIAGVHEDGEWEGYLQVKGLDKTYINSGVMIMDLKAIREQKLDDKMINLLNARKFAFPDQDVINITLKDKIKHISNKYNSTEITGFRDDAKIIHYIRERKGWIKESPRSNIWFQYYFSYIDKLLSGGDNMIKLIAEKDFTLQKFEELKNIVRNNLDEDGKIFKDDTFECTEDMAKYLTGENAQNISVARVIEVMPEEKKEPVKKIAKKATIKKETKKTTKKTTKKSAK